MIMIMFLQHLLCWNLIFTIVNAVKMTEQIRLTLYLLSFFNLPGSEQIIYFRLGTIFQTTSLV